MHMATRMERYVEGVVAAGLLTREGVVRAIHAIPCSSLYEEECDAIRALVRAPGFADEMTAYPPNATAASVIEYLIKGIVSSWASRLAARFAEHRKEASDARREHTALVRALNLVADEAYDAIFTRGLER